MSARHGARGESRVQRINLAESTRDRWHICDCELPNAKRARANYPLVLHSSALKSSSSGATRFFSLCLVEPQPLKRLFFFIIGPTHKRTGGRAPVWGSEFTTKVAPKEDFS
jgi:hypothetical protein